MLAPADEAQAYAVQRRVSDGLGAIGGWKVGASGPEARPPARRCPRPASSQPGARAAGQRSLRGVEAEICLPPRRRPAAAGGAVRPRRGDRRHRLLPAGDRVAGIRFTDPDAQDKLTLLADSLTHGGFVYGAPAADWQGIDFARETVRLLVDGRWSRPRPPTRPAT